jgi:dihydropteroate synthase
MVAPSRKSFLKQENEASMEFATASAVAACILNGAHIVRVHNVKAMRPVFEVADAIRQGGEEEEDSAGAVQTGTYRKMER